MSAIDPEARPFLDRFAFIVPGGEGGLFTVSAKQEWELINLHSSQSLRSQCRVVFIIRHESLLPWRYMQRGVEIGHEDKRPRVKLTRQNN